MGFASGMDFMTISIIVIVVAFVTIGLIIARLYKRSTKEMAFVRTGLGGEKVILNGGAVVLPVFHEITLVNMRTLRLEVARKNDQALITGDRMRVDVQAEFYVRVKPEANSIAQAAQALGSRTLYPDELKELIEGKFVDALRSVAAEMQMTELHEKRSDFVQKVQTVVAEDLFKNGLELETVSLTGLDQTSKEHFNPDNAFDAEGLLRLTEEIEERRKKRNDIERDTEVQIQQKNLQTTKESLNIKKDEEYANLEQIREIQTRRAEQEADIEVKRAVQKQLAEEAKIDSEKKIEQSRILSEQEIEQRKIQRDKIIELEAQFKQIEINNKSKEESMARGEADKARAAAVKEEEGIKTAREVEMAERKKRVEIIDAQREAEKEATELKVGAEAEKIAAQDRAEAVTIAAKAESEAVKIKAEAKEKDYEAEAKGKREINEAENKLSSEQIAAKLQMELFKVLPEIIAQSVKPMEKIESIKIMDTGRGGHMSAGLMDGSSSSDGTPTDMTAQIMQGLLKYRAQAPIVDYMLSSVGLKDGVSDISSVMKTLDKKFTTQPPEEALKQAPQQENSQT
jgi:uncharacterized membrane protein YqiK